MSLGGRPGRLAVCAALLVGATIALVAGWRRSERSTPAVDVVVLVSIDTLRADHLGCYGYGRPTSPVLDSLAAEGVLFEDVSSPAPWTLPAHASLLTGLYPSRHGLKSHTRYLPARIPTLASLLAQQGWVTAAAVNSHNLSARFGLDRGFQEFVYVEELADQREPTRRITDQALEWIERFAGRRLFLFLHYYDVHSDYRSLPAYEQEFVAPYTGSSDGTTAQLTAYREGRVALDEGDAAHLLDLYDAGIRQMDDELARLLARLRAGGRLERTLLVLTSDHGEEFLERGGVLHGRTQFQEVMRVPLVLRRPGLPAGRRIATPVSLLDVMPTLLSLLGVAAPEGLDGSDLGGLWRGSEPRLEERFLFGEADHNNAEPDITRAVRRHGHKLHFNRLTRQRALFDLSQDPGERRDLRAAQPAVAGELMAKLERFLELRAEGEVPLTLTPDEAEKLKSLGYLN